MQVKILNVTDRVNEYCESLQKQLETFGVRVEFDRRNEKLNYKIREAQLKKIPYMVIVGDKEAQEQMLSLRLRDGSTQQGMSLEDFKKNLLEDIQQRCFISPLLKNS